MIMMFLNVAALMDFAQEGELQLEKHRSLNKIGHALHYKYQLHCHFTY